MIHERSGLSPEELQLSFGGETLEDDRKLSSYRIVNNSLLVEETYVWIAVKLYVVDLLATKTTHKLFHLLVGPKETIFDIKAKIQESEGISRHQLEYFAAIYGPKFEVEDHKPLLQELENIVACGSQVRLGSIIPRL